MAEPTPPPATFHLPPAMRAAIIDHARADAPRECCGVVIGSEAGPTDLLQMTNVAEGNRLYEIDPAELLTLEFTTLPARSLSVLAIYHSHPVTEAYPSPTDRAQAFWPSAVYLICSLADPAVPVIRAFSLDTPEVQELGIT